ncbi:MAG: helix-turn-helix transcriptional regulator [Usitatibacter sp.]
MRLPEIGAQIRAARLSRGFTQGQLAARAGISRPTLSQLENGLTRDLGAAKVFRLLEAVGLQPVIVSAPSKRPTDHVALAVTTANVGFKTALTEDELIRALVTGAAPERKRPQMRRLLEDAPPSIVLGLQEQVGKWTKPGKVQKNLLKLARSLDIEPHPSWLAKP